MVKMASYKYDPPPGPQRPDKYPGYQVGPNYQRYGEQENFDYDPVSDEYFEKPEKNPGYKEPPKPPSLWETIGPVAGTAGAIYGAKGVAEAIPGAFKEGGLFGEGGVGGFIKDGASSLFGSGGGGAASEAGGAALPAGEAANVGWNAGADASMGFYGPGGDPSAVTGAADTGLGAFGQALSIAAILHGGYNLASNFGEGNWKGGAMSGAEAGAGVGTLILPGPGTAIGAGIGAITGGLLGAAKTGRTNKGTLARDAIRHGMRDTGLLDQDWNLTTSKGNKFYIGTEGGGRGEYQFDMNDQNKVALIPQADALARGILGPDASQEQITWLTSFYINGATSDAQNQDEAIANLNYFASDAAAKVQNAQAQGGQAAPGADPYKDNQRTMTKSPGIGLDGRRISY